MRPLRITRTLLSREFQKAEIARLTRVLEEAAKPMAVYCFGSANLGRATDQSDFDFLVVLDSSESFAEARRNLRPYYPLSSIPVDLVWKDKAEFVRLRTLGGISMVAWEQGSCTYCRPENRKELMNDKKAEV